ncbi:MAG TPA: TorF family putative porin [Accumulibacter sp.]|nr:TorF family putative porin [Accumulibacter sp.]HMW18572.1 TorF family putative porin [Accumulibacter sp.]HMX22189.1 TorF family putative porin [Accumulibacter sp.]HMY07506.1 TorF family putative porin [Accumulibacter sp.]HNC17719.1 TorF family putative porin [Accumulibacter sp.]
MKKTVAFIAVCALTGGAGVQAADPVADAVPPAAAGVTSPLTGNLSLVSSYRFRGIDQTFGKPALQGGVDFAHASGFYLGNWNSNVNSGAGYPDGTLEMDFYGGYKTSFGDFGVDVGAIYYAYPGSDARGLGQGRSGAVSNKELYLGGSWKFLSLKYFYAIDDYFSLRGIDASGSNTDQRTRGSQYLDFSLNYDLGDGWGINGHLGRLQLKNVANGNYTDWKVGVSKDLGGWLLAASYIDTNARGHCGGNGFAPYCFANSLSESGSTGGRRKDAGRAIAVISVSRSF